MRPAIRLQAIERAWLRQRCNLADGTIGPLTLLLAPAGYGKTVATLMWLENSGIPAERTYWVHASPDWEHPDEFWRAASEALTGPADGERAPRHYRRELERTLPRLTGPAALVIDSYQFITSPELDMQIAALAQLNPDLYVVVLSRRFATLDGPLVTSRTPATVIGVEDMAFSLDEVGQLARRYGVDDPETIASVHEVTSGWALAVQSVLSDSNHRGVVRQAAVISRLASESIESVTDPRAVPPLLAAALCGDIQVEMVSDLTGLAGKEASALMRDLEDLGLISRIWYPADVRFRCHPALAAALSERAVEEFGEQRASALRRGHAIGLSSDEPEAALRVLCELGEFESANRVMIRNFDRLVRPGNVTLGLLRRLDPEAIQDHFGLVGARTFLEYYDPGAPLQILEDWRRRMREATRGRLMTGDVEYRIAALGILMAAERIDGNGEESYRLARDLEKRLTDTSDRNLSSVRESLPLLYTVLAFTGLMNGDFEMSLRSYQHAWSIAEAVQLRHSQLYSLNGLVLTAAVIGDYRLAEHYLEKREAIRSDGMVRTDLTELYARVTRSLLASNRGDGKGAREQLIGDERLINRLDHLAWYLYAESAAVRILDGNREALLTLERRLRTRELGVRLVPFQRTMITAQAACLQMLMGDFSGAERRLSRLPDDHPDVMVARARLRLLTGESQDAARRADRARATPLAPRQDIEARLIGAVANWELGSHAEALRLLARGVERMRACGGGAWFLSMVPFVALQDMAIAARDAGTVDIADEVASLPETLRCLQFEVLTRAELRTLRALGKATSLREVAESLYLTHNTVKSHLRSLYRKLRVSNREEAVQRGLQIGLIEPRR